MFRMAMLPTVVLLLVSFCAAEPIDLGRRLEPLVDDFLIERTTGDLHLQVQQPIPGDVVLVTDKPWEGNTCAYYTIFRDGDLYRMYYRGSHADEKTRKSLHREVTCYAESRDGLHWTKPELGLFEYEGSKANNIILDGLGTHCFVAFKDENPDCPAEARYKGISHGKSDGKSGLHVFQSADGIHWSLIKAEPVITKGAFDSQNLAFWDPHTKKYVDYHRAFIGGVRSILTCTSDDFLHWTEPVPLVYPDAPNQHLYTNAVRPYFRAPHIRIGFPTRFIPETEQVEPVFMSSRDGITFGRYAEAVIPQSAPADRDGNRSNYMANGLVSLDSEPGKLSVYATEAYYAGPDSRLRRFTYRVDGFVSMTAGDQGGELLTRPLRFEGNRLFLNYVTRPGGSIRVEVQSPDGRPIEGYRLGDFQELVGDHIQQAVRWGNRDTLAIPSGTPVRLRFVMRNAELYSLRFSSQTVPNLIGD